MSSRSRRSAFWAAAAWVACGRRWRRRRHQTSCSSTARSSPSTPQSAIAEAVAVSADRIAAVGSVERYAPAGRPPHADRRPAGPHGDARAHRLAPARRPGRARRSAPRSTGSARVRCATRWAGSRAASRAMPPGSWLIVAGGWNELQFAERRRPTQAELEAAAPDNPVYVQLGYGWAVMTDDGFDDARHRRRRRSAGGRHAGARRRAAHGRRQRRATRDHRAVRSVAEADVRGAGARARASSSASSIGWGSRASSIPAATICSRPITRRCSTCGAAAS